jgi:hypothetical protein
MREDTGMRGDTVTTKHDDSTSRTRRRAAAHSATEEALVSRLESLTTEFAATPDEDFRAATRARLVAMAAVRAPAAETAGRRPPVRVGALRRLLAGAPDAPAARWRLRLTAGLAGVTLTVTALGGLLAAAQGARPGDLLYDLKRGGEQTQLALAGDSQRGLTLLDFASTRLDELSELVGVEPNADAVVGTTPSGGEAGLAAGPDVHLVIDTLQTMDEQTTKGTAALTSRVLQQSDPGALGKLTGWTDHQQSGLGRLTDAVPTGARSALSAAQDLVAQVAARGVALEAALACPGGPSTAGTDEFGPVPAVCPPAAPPTAGTPTPSVPGQSPDTAGTAGTSGTSGTAGTSTSGSGTGTGTAGSPPGTGAGPTAAVPGAPPTGGTPPTTPPDTTSLPGLPLPSLPSLLPSRPSLLPSLPSVLPSLPSLPGSPPSTNQLPSSPSGPLVELPLSTCLDVLGTPGVC